MTGDARCGAADAERPFAALVEDAAAALRGMSCRASPVHLHSIARALGVVRIAVDPTLDSAGRVVWDGSRPAVYLSAQAEAPRRRFTLAHELAHVLLGHGAPAAADRAASMSLHTLQDDERLADAVAGATLIGPEEVQRLRQLDQIELDHVREAASRLQVSMSAVVARLTTADPRPRYLVGLRWTDGEWVARRFVGRTPGLPRTLTVPWENAGDLERLPAKDRPVTFTARIGDSAYELSGTGNRRGDGALVLVTRIHHLGPAAPRGTTAATARRG